MPATSTDLCGSIVDRWNIKAELCALLAASKVYVGTQYSDEPPYAIVKRTRTDKLAQTNRRRIDAVEIEIAIYGSDQGAVRAIVNKLREPSTLDGFHKDKWIIFGDYVVISMMAGEDREERNEKGLWVATVAFTVNVQTPTG